MDTRTGKLYRTLDDALADGVPPDKIKEIKTKTILRGPFKGRTYIVDENGRWLKRVTLPTDKEKLNAEQD